MQYRISNFLFSWKLPAIATSLLVCVMMNCLSPVLHADEPNSSKDGLSMKVVLQKQYVAGMTIPVNIEINNSSNTEHALYLFLSKDLLGFDFDMKDSDGKSVTLTKYGQQRADMLKNPITRDKILGLPLLPGKSQLLKIDNIALFYDLTLPGSYTLTTTRLVKPAKSSGNDTIVLKSEKIEFKVVKPDAPWIGK